MTELEKLRAGLEYCYDEGMVRRLIERITVYEDHLDFEFKSGLETEVQM